MLNIATPTKKNQHNTRSRVVMNVVYMPKIYITHYYHGVIGNLKKNIEAKMLKTEGLAKIKLHI